jgi:hypothetical protein
MRTQSIALLLFALTWGYAAAQTTPEEPSPATMLEQFAVTDGAVIVRGSSTIGVIRATNGGRVIVKSEEFTNVGNGRKEHGIAVEVREAGTTARESTSYIDYNDIDALLKGLDYLANVNSSATKLDHVRADYRTRGHLAISASSTTDGGKASVLSGTTETGKVRVSLKQSDLEQLRGLIADAKRKLDGIK